MSGAPDPALAADAGLAAVAARLVGTWRLVRWTIVPEGAPRAATSPYGDDAQGLLVYTADGWMSGAIAHATRAPFSIGTLRTAPERERLASFESYYHYAARYTVRQGAAGPQVVHAVRMALNPGMVGTEQVRDIAFDADGALHLSAPERHPRDGSIRHHRLHWRPAASDRSTP